jgi:hypothetical protein
MHRVANRRRDREAGPGSRREAGYQEPCHQALRAYPSLCFRWGERLKGILSFCRPVSTREQVRSREAAFKARRMGDQMHGRKHHKRNEEVEGRRHEAQRLCWKQLMYYPCSLASWYHCLIQDSLEPIQSTRSLNTKQLEEGLPAYPLLTTHETS